MILYDVLYQLTVDRNLLAQQLPQPVVQPIAQPQLLPFADRMMRIMRERGMDIPLMLSLLRDTNLFPIPGLGSRVTVPTTTVSPDLTRRLGSSPTPVIGGWPAHLNRFGANPGTVMSPEIEGRIREAGPVVQHYQPPQQYGAGIGQLEVITVPIPQEPPPNVIELTLEKIRVILKKQVYNHQKTPEQVFRKLSRCINPEEFVTIITEKPNAYRIAEENRGNTWRNLRRGLPRLIFKNLYNYFEQTDADREIIYNVLRLHGKAGTGRR
uniref:CUT domain-containing protein n=1 Tax=Caenorhabditis tropicalis TaxID=1561998 RepID=A0A1I7UJ97_9PELO